tara:strand:- start:4964 stop:5812 length:849 start_codon:yes stop_codon:yes gene_type:complete
MISFDPDILIHMAAQPLVRHSYINPVETYNTNVMGTLNVLESARKCDNLRSILVITTDKCYENLEIERGYKEEDKMGGHDPYSSSKGCCELLVSSYRRSFFNNLEHKFIASARSGNVLGGGDWSEDRIIPDILKSMNNSRKLHIRNPKSTRPWQHVLEPLSGYLILLEKLFNEGSNFEGAWNFGPKYRDCKSVEWILENINNIIENRINYYFDEDDNFHEAKILKLDISKSRNKLGWHPKLDLKETLKSVICWHEAWLKKADMKKYCISEINNYTNLLHEIE